MTMSADGIPKLIEELGELQQVLGKRLAYWHTDQHPDGTNLRDRLHDEIGDVYAALHFVEYHHGLDVAVIDGRRQDKSAILERWHREPDNNDQAIDRSLT